MIEVLERAILAVARVFAFAIGGVIFVLGSIHVSWRGPIIGFMIGAIIGSSMGLAFGGGGINAWFVGGVFGAFVGYFVSKQIEKIGRKP